jgi:hypothetical protein
MQAAAARRVLVVANRTASTPVVVQAVSERAVAQPTHFTLLIPAIASRRADWTLEEALKALRKAARGPHENLTPQVDGLVGGPDPFESVKQALALERYDEVIVSTLPRRISEWLKRDLPSRVEALGVPVTTITPLTDQRGTFAQFTTYVQPGRRGE